MSTPRKALFLAVTILAFLFVAIFFFRPIELEDSWWHLATGRWITTHLQVPHTDPFAMTEQKTPWVLTQWLGSTVYYLIYMLGGFLGLKIFRSLVFVSILLTYFAFSRRKIPTAFLLVLIFLLTYALDLRYHLRPDVFNFLFIQFFLVFLFDYWNNGRKKNLLWIVALGALWSNINVGSFVFGGAILLSFLIAAVVEGFKQGGTQKRSKELGLTALAFFLAFAVSPYGFQAAAYPWQVFLIPSQINFYKFSHVVAEMLPPAFLLTIYGFAYLSLIAVGGLVLYFTRVNRFLYTMLFAFSLALFLYTQRTGPFFAFVVAYLVREYAIHHPWKERWQQFKWPQTLNNALCGLLIVILLFNTWYLLNQKIFRNGRLTSDLAVEISPYNPDAALRFLAENHIEGPVFNWEGYGGYLFWFSYPKLKPFVDTRQLNQEFFALYSGARNKSEKFWPLLEERFGFKIVLMDGAFSSNIPFLRYLQAQPSWQLVLVDGSCVLFLKREEPGQDLIFPKPDPALLEQVKSRPAISVQQKLIQYIDPGPYYIDHLEKAVTLSDLGYKSAAIAYALKAIEVSDTEFTRFVLSLVESKKE